MSKSFSPMGYLIAVDTSLSMGLSVDGKQLKRVDNVLEKTRFDVAADIVEAVISLAGKLNVEPVVHLFRIGESYNNLGDVSSVEDVVGMITKRGGKKVELIGCTNMSRFMAFVHEQLHPTMEDKIIILTDCSTFEGDVNYAVNCETRFVIVNTNKASMSEMQLEELDEIAASSIGHEALPENESLYHHFFLADFPSISEIGQSVFSEMFEMSVYTLQMGHLKTDMKIGHSFHQPGVETINVIGFLRPTALQNMEATGSHFCHPVYFKEETAPSPSLSGTPTNSNLSEDEEDESEEETEEESDEDMDDEDEYEEIEVEVEVEEDEEEEQSPPKRSFMPFSVVDSEEPKTSETPKKTSNDNKRIDISSIFAASNLSAAETEPVLADFVPPPTAEASAAAEPEAEVSSSAPKRKWKVVSGSGVETEYVSKSRPVVPPPAFEPIVPMEEEKKEKTPTPPPPKKKTIKIVKRRVLKKRKEVSVEKSFGIDEETPRRQRNGPREDRIGREEEMKEEVKEEENAPQYDKDVMAAFLEARGERWSATDDDSDSEVSKRMSRRVKKKSEKKEGEEKKATTPFKDSKKKKRVRRIQRRGDQNNEAGELTAPYLVQMITAGMKNEEMNAVCLLDNGEYAILTVDQNSDGDDLLIISTILDQAVMPSFIPQFKQLTTVYDNSNSVDNFYLTLPVGHENPSYISARSSWFNEDGIEADFVRIRKNLRKIPERLPHFYGDINRMRFHAYTTCFQEMLPGLADQLIDEATQVGELAVRHAEYIALFYRKVVPYAEVRDIQMPNF